MLDKWQVISLGVILSLPALHYGGDFYLHSMSSQTLRDHISVVPNVFAILGTALFLVKGGLSYKAIEKMISKSPRCWKILQARDCDKHITCNRSTL